MEAVVEVPIEKLIISPYNVREDPERNIEVLVESIREVGLLQPLTVRKSKKYPDKYEVIIGARRLTALRRLKKRGEWGDTVPVIIKDLDDFEALLLSLHENIKQRTLTETEKARAVKRLREEFGLSEGEIARRTGITVRDVTNLLKILRVLEDIGKEMVTKPGRWGERRRLAIVERPPKTEEVMKVIPSSIVRIITGFSDSLSRYEEFKHEDLKRVLAEELGVLQQRQLIEAIKKIRKEYKRARVEGRKGMDTLLDIVRKARKESIEKVSLNVLIDSSIKNRIENIRRKYNVPLSTAVEICLKIGLKHSAELESQLKIDKSQST
ncbi:MAG: hypothetical protein DRN53_04165 [Thermoprotei archaeon]|nr:MAG: hypothetical protein DRN53_04165 [Thermoprotei archaeon]